jgi:hypothetical protein
VLQIRTVSTCGAFLMALHDILIKRDLRRIQSFNTYLDNIWNPDFHGIILIIDDDKPFCCSSPFRAHPLSS